jgi:hypothetical protein
MALLTIILSGPKTVEQQARTALASAGYSVHPTSHDHGLPSTPTGKKVRQAVSFLTVEAEDVDAVAATVAPLSYVLRMHHDTPEPPVPSAEERIAATLAGMQREITELKAQVGDR